LSIGSDNSTTKPRFYFAPICKGYRHPLCVAMNIHEGKVREVVSSSLYDMKQKELTAISKELDFVKSAKMKVTTERDKALAKLAVMSVELDMVKTKLAAKMKVTTERDEALAKLAIVSEELELATTKLACTLKGTTERDEALVKLAAKELDFVKSKLTAATVECDEVMAELAYVSKKLNFWKSLLASVLLSCAGLVFVFFAFSSVWKAGSTCVVPDL
jgi:hypothetical protein